MVERQAFGIDINEFSRTGGINYDLVKENIQTGVYDFLIIKAGLGTFQSPLFNEQSQNVEKLGIPYSTYHLLDPRQDMKEQAQSYVNWVGTGQPSYILDIESPSAGINPPNRGEILANINELTGLTNKQPIIYSSVEILNQIGFANDARQYQLWIAQYLFDESKLPAEQVQYRYFDDFIRDHAGQLPSTVLNTAIADNVILWQFSAKGDGLHYIYSQTTADPKFPMGMVSADLSISIKGRDEFMQLMFGRVPVIEESGGQSEAPTLVDPDSNIPRPV